MKTLIILISFLASLFFDKQPTPPSKYHLVTANKSFYAKPIIQDLNKIRTYNDFVNSNETYQIISCDYLYAVRGGDVSPRHISNMKDEIVAEDLLKIQAADNNTMIIIDNILAKRNDGVIMILGSVTYKIAE